MKELRLGEVLLTQRRKRGVTQEQLAAYLGVSKAAVSKWETGATYPDITLLPVLAAYFDLTMDALMGYAPQMPQEEIGACYLALAADFAHKPFGDVLDHCHQLEKKYYSCHPLLFHLGALLVNHCVLAENPQQIAAVLEEAKALFQRVKAETDSPNLAKQALQMEAHCAMALGQPEEVLGLLSHTELDVGPSEPVLASAYHMLGNGEAAARVLQQGIYQQMLCLCATLSSYLALAEGEAFQMAAARLRAITETFELKTLHPAMCLTYWLTEAQGWARLGEEEKAMGLLRQYADLATGDIYPLTLHGDAFFGLLDPWEQLSLGTHLPVNDTMVRRNLTAGVAENPAFQCLQGREDFACIVARLRSNEAAGEEKEHERSMD